MFAVQVPIRVSAASMAVSGLLVAVATPLHPDVLTGPVSDVVVEASTIWTPLHVLYLLSIVLAFVGACGFIAVDRNRLGRLGQAALAASLAGAVSGSAIMALEAVAFPILAVSGPEVLALAGPFVPVLGVLSGVALGTAQVSWGWMMWHSTKSLPPEDPQ